MSKLLSGSPGAIAGPLSPPLSKAARESTRRPWLTFLSPWHLKHLPRRTGRIFSSKNVSSARCAHAMEADVCEKARANIARQEKRSTVAALVQPAGWQTFQGLAYHDG